MGLQTGECGVATLDFGATPSAEASVVVGGTPIVPEAFIEVHLAPIPGQPNNNEHLVAPIELRVGDIVPGAGFTVYGRWVGGPIPQRRYGVQGSGLAPRTVGEFGIAWAWRTPS